MVRTLIFFVKAAVVAFSSAFLFLGAVVWLTKSLVGEGAPAALENPPVEEFSSRGESSPAVHSGAGEGRGAQKRSAAARIVSAFQFAEQVEVSKRRAVERYPELGVKDSTVNREFVRRMRLYQSVNPDFFEEVTWPEKLADILAVDLSLDPQKASNSASPVNQ